MSQASEIEVRQILATAFERKDIVTDKAFSPDGMKLGELVRLYEMIRDQGVQQALEVGMATGTSSVVIANAIRQNGGAGLTSIDPFQTVPAHYDSAGLRAIRAAGLRIITG